MRRFVSEPIEPTQGGFATPATGSEPPLPRAFAWAGRELVVKTILRVWRTSKNDRGDDYLKRHWYEVETEDGARAQLYYDREVRRGQSHWWLFTIET
jgi:hypothetical protein